MNNESYIISWTNKIRIIANISSCSLPGVSLTTFPRFSSPWVPNNFWASSGVKSPLAIFSSISLTSVMGTPSSYYDVRH